MTTATFELLASRAAIASIDAYRLHISPHKGFSCPHRLLHQDESCSEYVRRILTEQRLSEAIQLASQRFKACNAAAKTLTLQKAQGGCIVIPCCFPI